VALINQDLEDTPPQLGQALPAGVYQCVVTNSMKLHSKHRRPVLKLIYTITQGPSTGALLTDTLPLDMASGMITLKSLAIAAGCPTPDYIEDSSVLHGLNVMVVVDTKENTAGQYVLPNIVSGYQPIS